MQMSLGVQQDFGLRREEATRTRPDLADGGGSFWLKPNGTKGGPHRPALSGDEPALDSKARAVIAVELG